MSTADRAWDCAYALWSDHAARLSAQQAVRVYVALMAGPERAGLECIALAAQIIGTRT